MTQYVLTLSIGPVQGFIASARRSRDLWSGSWLLSEMAKAAAKSLFEAGAQMVFPFVDEATKDRLEPCDRMDNNFQSATKFKYRLRRLMMLPCAIWSNRRKRRRRHGLKP